MSITRISNSDKVKKAISLLKEDLEKYVNELKENNWKIAHADKVEKDAKMRIVELDEEYKRVSQQYKQAQKDKQIYLLRNPHIINSQYIINTYIETKEIELSVVNYEEQEKGKGKGKKREPILDKINKLPKDMVLLIGEYLPYSVRIELLESTKKTSLTLTKMPYTMMYMLLNIICTDKDFINLLTYEEAIKQIPKLPNESGELVINPLYKPFYLKDFGCDISRDIKLRIKYIIHLAKEANAKFAYNIMKLIRVLFNTSKKYIITVDMGFIQRRRNALQM